MRPIRVVWLVKEFAPGGAERLLLEICKPLEGEVEFFPAAVSEEPRSFLPEYLKEGLPAVTLGARSELDLRWLRAFARLVRRVRPEVIHMHLPYSGAMGRLGMIGRGIPLVYTEHSFARTHHAMSRWANALTMWMNAVVIAVSPVIARDVVSRPFARAVRSKVVVIENGIGIERVRADARRSLEPGVELSPQTFGAIGPMRRAKGIDIFLEAAELVRRELPDATPIVLRLAGDQLPTELCDVARRASARFLGVRQDARAIIGGLGVFVIPSRAEGMPMALLEAMALARPVVATAVGGIPGIVEDGVSGLLVPPERPSELAEAIIRVFRDPALAERLGRRAAEVVVARFSSQQTARRHLEVYRSLLGAREAT